MFRLYNDKECRRDNLCLLSYTKINLKHRVHLSICMELDHCMYIHYTRNNLTYISHLCIIHIHRDTLRMIVKNNLLFFSSKKSQALLLGNPQDKSAVLHAIQSNNSYYYSTGYQIHKSINFYCTRQSKNQVNKG